MKQICLFLLLLGVVFLGVVVATEEKVEDAEVEKVHEDAEDKMKLGRFERASERRCSCVCATLNDRGECPDDWPDKGYKRNGKHAKCCKQSYICCLYR